MVPGFVLTPVFGVGLRPDGRPSAGMSKRKGRAPEALSLPRSIDVSQSQSGKALVPLFAVCVEAGRQAQLRRNAIGASNAVMRVTRSVPLKVSPNIGTLPSMLDTPKSWNLRPWMEPRAKKNKPMNADATAKKCGSGKKLVERGSSMPSCPSQMNPAPTIAADKPRQKKPALARVCSTSGCSAST